MWLDFECLPRLYNIEILYSNSSIADLQLAILTHTDYYSLDQLKCYNRDSNNKLIKSYENRLIIYSGGKQKGYVLLFKSPTDLYDKRGNNRVYDRVLSVLSVLNFEIVFNWLEEDDNINKLDNVLRDIEREDCLYLDKYRQWLNDNMTILRMKSKELNRKEKIND